MSFLDHLEGLRWHLIRSVIAIAVVMLGMFFFVTELINDVVLAPLSHDFPTLKFLCSLGTDLCPPPAHVTLQATEPAEQFTRAIMVAIVGGFIVAFPYVFWELWSFIKPGLYVKEIKKTRGVIFIVSSLFFTGVLFGYFIVTPFTLNFFASFKISPQVENIWRVGNVIALVVQIALAGGLLFQMPVVAYFLAKIGVIGPVLMRKYQRHAIVVCLVVAGILTPSPDLMSQMLLAVPMLLLYQVSIVIVARVARKRAANEAAEEAERNRTQNVVQLAPADEEPKD
jgi:sec-independent protein translocase protein TatC